MSAPPTPRRRALFGLALGSLLAVGVGLLWLDAVRTEESRRAADQSAIAGLRALTATLEGALASGKEAGAVVGQWRARGAEIERLRVVSLEERTLLASTSAADQAAGVTPRRLAREEKPLFDAANELRAAVDNNRSGEGPKKEVIALTRLPEGGRQLWGALARDGAVVGAVDLVRKPLAPSAPPVTWLWPLAAALAPTLLFAVFAPRAGGSRRALLALAALLLVGGVALFGWHAARALAADRLASEAALGAEIGVLESRAGEVASLLGASLKDGAAWDVDRYGEPRGVLASGGQLVTGRSATLADEARTAAIRGGFLAGFLGLGLTLFLGSGAGRRTWDTLVRFRVAYAYVTPALFGMLVLVFFPFFYGITLSFTNSNIYNSDQPLSKIWTGLQNYKDILSDFAIWTTTEAGGLFNYKNFYYTFGFNVIWTVLNVAVGVTVGLLLALVLNTKGLALKPIYRVLLVLPWAVPNYITALIWKGMFHQQFGVINQIIQISGGEPVSWFEKPVTSFLTVWATNGWLSFPFMMVICLGALQSIPADLYEAARVDGASRWQQFRSITLPSLKPALVPAVILSVIWTFNMFNIIYLVSQGEPASSTEILITQAYKIAFEQYRYGYAAAYSTVIFFILLAYGVWQNRVTQATEGI